MIYTMFVLVRTSLCHVTLYYKYILRFVNKLCSVLFQNTNILKRTDAFEPCTKKYLLFLQCSLVECFVVVFFASESIDISTYL